MKALCLLALAAGVCSLVTGRAVLAGVVSPHLDTDRAVDTRSAKTICRDLIADDMSNEQKALAIFHWLRRVIYHSGPEEPLRHDFNLMINVFGYGSCYMQTHPLSHLYQQLGWPCRNWLHNGHHMLEVHYDGAWHCLDPHMSFYVYNRADPPAIASVAELRADRTLAFDAVKEKRTAPAFLICGDSPNWFAGDEGWRLDHDFLPHRGADEQFGAIRLPRGTRYVRTWKAGRFYKPHAFGKDGVGPYHTCGQGSDRRDEANFPYWEPYLCTATRRSYRHHGTGFIEYAPDLRGDGWKDGAIRFVNLTGDRDEKAPALHPVAGGIASEVIFHIDCPYIVTGATMECEGRGLGKAGDVTVSVSTEWAGRRRKWKEIWPGGASESRPFGKLDMSPVVAGSVKGYWLRITMKATDPARTGVSNLKIRTDFQLNPYALPQLLPGPNKLLATAARNDGPWRLRLSWAEGEGWSQQRQYEATVKGASHQADLEVAGPKFPRMESLEFCVDP